MLLLSFSVFTPSAQASLSFSSNPANAAVVAPLSQSINDIARLGKTALIRMAGPASKKRADVCHSPRPWLISFSLDLLPDGETSHFWVSCHCRGRASLFFLCGASPTRCHQRASSRRRSRIENHAEHYPRREIRTSLASADAADIYHDSFDRQHVP